MIAIRTSPLLTVFVGIAECLIMSALFTFSFYCRHCSHKVVVVVITLSNNLINQSCEIILSAPDSKIGHARTVLIIGKLGGLFFVTGAPCQQMGIGLN